MSGIDFISKYYDSIMNEGAVVFENNAYEVRIDSEKNRVIRSKDDSFHLLFLHDTGFTAKWGKTFDEDPTHCPWGNEIADIEVTTVCNGIRNKDGFRSPCPFCFVPGTKITMADGSRMPIEEIKVGDHIRTFRKNDDGNYEMVINEVKEVYERDYESTIVSGLYTNGNYASFDNWICTRIPAATPNHPFMTPDGKTINAEELFSKEIVYESNTPEGKSVANIGTVMSMLATPKNVLGKVYNFHCAPDETYIADGVWVHNCYKSNSSDGAYMTVEEFSKIFDKIDQPKTMTQIALGTDAECNSNPDIWKIMDYCNDHNVVPNVTVADIDEETAANIVSRCGACAVSCYQRDKNRCYDSIKLLVDESKKQNKRMKINMHLLVGKEMEDFVFEVLNDRLTDPRLSGMGAIVLLSLKKKGRGSSYHKMDDEVYSKAIEFLEKHGIAYGSDSCGANRLVRSLSKIHTEDEMRQISQCIEACESCMYSIFINVKGELFPCSFMEKEYGWESGIDLKEDRYNNFTTKVWNHPRILEWRQNAIRCINCNGCNQCPHYEI